MSEFEFHNQANDEAQQKKSTAFLFKQDSVGLATDGVLTGLGVTQTGTASANVLVASGAGVVQDTVGNGASLMVNDTQKTLDVLTANPMGGTPRNDIVAFDSATTSIRVIVGTPNAVPTDPTVPNTAFPLARLRHAASATTVPTAKIDDLRVTTYLFGTEPNDYAWVAYTPTVRSDDTGALLGSSGATGRYRIIGKSIRVQGSITVTSTTTGLNYPYVSLPFTGRDRVLGFGTCAAWGSSTPADQSGQGYMRTDKVSLVIAAYSGGFRNVTGGNVIRWDVEYELP